MAMNSTTGPEPYDVVRVISAEGLLQALRSNVRMTIIDVRDRPQIHATGTIADARTFPLCQLGSRIAELDQLRATPLVVVSQRARRAKAAALELQAAGFAEVLVLDGGLHRWLELGYPVEERRESVPPSSRR